MGEFMEVIAKQYKKMVNAQRINVLFYDMPRKELYKRVRENNKEVIKGTLINN